MTPVVMMLPPQKALACKKRDLKNGEGKNSLLFAQARRFGEVFILISRRGMILREFSNFSTGRVCHD